ncbi:MAG: isochorismatase family cysteine hydrolase [Nitrospira sp.]
MVLPNQSSESMGATSGFSDIALLIITMINPFTFPGAEDLFPAAYDAAGHICRLKQSANQAAIPVIYINDNFGTWRHDFQTLVRQCRDEPCRGQAIAELLAPSRHEYFVLKPKHSAFFATPLEILLQSLRTRRLILTGVTGDQCILYTAADAYMRGYGLFVPTDCTASLSARVNEQALEHMRTYFHADTCVSEQLIPAAPPETLAKCASRR